MKTEYRQDIYHSYLILSGGAEIDRDAYPLHMIRNNEIPGFLPCRVEEMDEELLFYYDITSRQTLRNVMETQAVDASLLRMLFLLIPAAMETLSEFLLDPDGMLLSPELIYMNSERNRMWFCYYPGSEDKLAVSLQMLGEGILPRLDHTDREAVILGYAFYQKCCAQEDDIPVDFFRNIMKESGPEDPEEIRREEEKEQEKQQELIQSFFDEDDMRKDKEVRRERGRKQQKKKKSVFFRRFRRTVPDDDSTGTVRESGENHVQTEDPEIAAAGWQETELPGYDGEGYPGSESDRKRYHVLSGDVADEISGARSESARNGCNKPASARKGYDEEEETQILQDRSPDRGKAAVPAKLVFIRADRDSQPLFLRQGEEFVLDRPSYIIGKSSRAAGVIIPCPTVSRVHASLTWEPAENNPLQTAGYVLQDLHSKNGTSVNGNRVIPDQRVALRDGDEITFAELIFRYIIDASQSDETVNSGRQQMHHRTVHRTVKETEEDQEV